MHFRTKPKFRLAVTTLLAFGCISTTAHGSGFGVFTQGASGLGQANAVVAHPDGPSALYFNPALMSKLPGTQLEIGTTLLFPTREYTAPDGSTANTRDRVFTPSTFYLSQAVTDSFNVGLGVFNPFGLGTDWGSDWGGVYGGRYLATNSELTTWNINPAMSYRIIPNMTVAAGLDIVLLDATLQSTAPPSTTIPFEYGQKFTGSGDGLGYNFGLYLELPYKLSLGATYRSQVNIDVDGDFTADVLPAGVNGKASIKLPQQVTAGLAYTPTDQLVVEAGMRWEDWSCFDQLHIQFSPNPFGLTSVTYPRDWHSTYAFNVGGKYRVNDTCSVMAGYLHGWNPVPDSTFEPAIPDSDTNLYTVGGEVRFKGFTFDLAYGYQAQSDRFKGTNLYGPAGTGTYKTYMNIVSMSIGYKF